jgi:hypothetical protein
MTFSTRPCIVAVVVTVVVVVVAVRHGALNFAKSGVVFLLLKFATRSCEPPRFRAWEKFVSAS